MTLASNMYGLLNKQQILHHTADRMGDQVGVKYM